MGSTTSTSTNTDSAAATTTTNTTNTTTNTANSKKKFQVVFVLGGPGAGKGTQCTLLSTNLGWGHLSAGDLLRAERKSGSSLAAIINNKISAGAIVPSSITVRLIKNAMEELHREKNITKFLIDGFPRSKENVDVWNEQMDAEETVVEFVLHLECLEHTMTERLLERAKTSGRDDDNLETIRSRFKTHRESTQPIIDYYKEKDMVKEVEAHGTVEEVYAEVEPLFKGL